MSKTDPSTTMDRLLHALGAIQAAHGCLQGSTIANAGIIADYLGEASITIKGIIKADEIGEIRKDMAEMHPIDECADEINRLRAALERIANMDVPGCSFIARQAIPPSPVPF